MSGISREECAVERDELAPPWLFQQPGRNRHSRSNIRLIRLSGPLEPIVANDSHIPEELILCS